MKPKASLLLICLVSSFYYSCEKSELANSKNDQNYFIIKESKKKNVIAKRASLDEPCIAVDLVAGQNDVVGSVTIDRNETHLILTYSTNDVWDIDLTHMSIGDCNEQWVPQTGSGNPKIGRFEHTEPHTESIKEVVYFVNLEVLPDYTDMYCFAAHAEVSGPNGGETAWAGQIGGANVDSNSQSDEFTVQDFDGNSWAMYIEASQTSCDVVNVDTPNDNNTGGVR